MRSVFNLVPTKPNTTGQWPLKVAYAPHRVGRAFLKCRSHVLFAPPCQGSGDWLLCLREIFMHRFFWAAALLCLGALAGFGTFRWMQPQDYHVLNGHSLRAAYLVPTEKDQIWLHLIVQAGERDNTGTEGIPHYVEHLAWMNAMGQTTGVNQRHSNAFTSALATAYVLNLPPDQAGPGLQSLAKVLAPLPPDNDFMRSERNIVLREYDFRMRENPMNSLIDRLNQAGYINDPIARSVIGTPDAIAAFSLDEARAWHSATHLPANAVLLMSGPISPAMAQRLVAQAFPAPPAGSLAQATDIRPVDFRMGPQETLQRRYRDAGFAQSMINLQTTVEILPPMDIATQTAQLDLLFDLLDSTLEGSYAKPLHFDASIAQEYYIDIFALSDRHYELSILGARPDKGVDLDQLKDGLLAAIQGARIPMDSFTRVKDRWLKRIEGAEPADITFALLQDAITRRTRPAGYHDYLAAAKAIELADMNRFAAAFAGPSRTIIDMISPQ